MKKKLKLVRLTLIGSRKNYAVSFKDGLNFITGPTTTGKTSILEMIDYALGAKEHKDYIEIGSSCSDVELEFFIGDERFRLKRNLADVKAAVIIEDWDEEKLSYRFLNRLEIDMPSNPRSLSAFLVEKIGLADITIMNQQLSFRDVFKYSYLKQTEIDNEDIMKESDWVKNNKRKAVFELVFKVYDELLEQYKSTLKKRTIEKKELEISVQSVRDFLNAISVDSAQEIARRALELSAEQERLRNNLSKLKQGNRGEEPDASRALQQRISDLRERAKCARENVTEQGEYLNKLRLLYNQYSSEIHKKQLAIDGYFAFNQFEYVSCPNCLRPLHIEREATDVCFLCGCEKTTEQDELLVLRKELATIKRKANELLKFIEVQESKRQGFIHVASECERSLAEAEQELNQVMADYVNPHIEQIEILNYEIGRNNRQQHELAQSVKAMEELERLEKILRDKEAAILSVKNTISGLEDNNFDKMAILANLTTAFTAVLQAFQYPKLSNSYIDTNSYLPYVRGQKYKTLGSLAGVSLITMAYYLSILIEGMDDKYCHLNLLMIDSPRKNLGAKAKQGDEEEFKDERILNNILRWMIEFCSKNAERVQLIVVNNGYPDFFPKDAIVAEFDDEGHNDLPVGLIDDAE